MQYKTISITASLAAICLLLAGCTSFLPTSTVAERASGYTYVPIDPFSVNIVTPEATNTFGSSLTGSEILRSLPDNAVRVAVEQFDSQNNVTYGPAGIAAKGGVYKITVDYINADTSNIKLLIQKTMEFRTHTNGAFQISRRSIGINEIPPYNCIKGSELYDVTRVPAGPVFISNPGTEYNIPIYIGIGLRITAEIKTLEGQVNISGLGAIGVAADTKSLSGSLVVQTLGVNGKSVSAALPIQSELNQTTAQNAITAVGAIKALLYEPETVVVPRVVGLYLPFAGGKPLVNAIISALSTERIDWKPATSSVMAEK